MTIDPIPDTPKETVTEQCGHLRLDLWRYSGWRWHADIRIAGVVVEAGFETGYDNYSRALHQALERTERLGYDHPSCDFEDMRLFWDKFWGPR